MNDFSRDIEEQQILLRYKQIEKNLLDSNMNNRKSTANSGSNGFVENCIDLGKKIISLFVHNLSIVKCGFDMEPRPEDSEMAVGGDGMLQEGVEIRDS